MPGPRRRSAAPHPTYPCRCGRCGNIDYYLFLSVNSGLDISDSSSKAELKAAFRAAMLRLHPDKISQSGLDPEKATEMSKFLLTVRDTLSDFEKKNSYDIQHSDLWKDSSSDGDSSDCFDNDWEEELRKKKKQKRPAHAGQKKGAEQKKRTSQQSAGSKGKKPAAARQPRQAAVLGCDRPIRCGQGTLAYVPCSVR